MDDPVVSNIILLQIKKVAESSDGDFQRCDLTCHVFRLEDAAVAHLATIEK